MNKKPIISICIPTYNRGNKVFELVTSILKYKESNIEVIVLDNFSSDNTNFLLNEIKDNRFAYLRNSENIGGIKNIFKALLNANGKYCFLCLDKDRINYNNIEELIKRIDNNQDVSFGYCILNGQYNKSDILFSKGFSSVYNMSYRSAHPTGMFYKTDFLKNLPVIKKIFEENKKFGFYTELINAEMSVLGMSKVVNLPVFFTETKEESEEVKSFTYKNENEIFFFPHKRYEEFLTYSSNLYSLDLTDNEKNKILKKIFLNGLVAATIEFKKNLKDRSVCNHYLVKSRNVSFLELFKTAIIFSRDFIKSDIPVSLLIKIYISVIGNFKVVYMLTGIKIIK